MKIETHKQFNFALFVSFVIGFILGSVIAGFIIHNY